MFKNRCAYSSKSITVITTVTLYKTDNIPVAHPDLMATQPRGKAARMDDTLCTIAVMSGRSGRLTNTNSSAITGTWNSQLKTPLTKKIFTAKIALLYSLLVPVVQKCFKDSSHQGIQQNKKALITIQRRTLQYPSILYELT